MRSIRRVWIVRATQLAAILAIAASDWNPASGWAHAAGRKRPAPEASSPPAGEGARGKVTLELSEIPRAAIEVPTTSGDSVRTYDFAPGFRERLTHDLTTAGTAIVMHTVATKNSIGTKALVGGRSPEDPVWDGVPVPAARLRIFVESMTFQSGSGGDRMSYGYDERMQGEFSDPGLTRANEFPMRETDFAPNWFDRSFDWEGDWNTGSRAGLDLGQGFKLDALFAFLALKYAAYRADVTLRLELDSQYSTIRRSQTLQVSGRGFYFDVAGGYANWSAQIALARRDALGKAVGRAFDGSMSAIREFLREIPKAAMVHAIDSSGEIYLNTGMGAEIAPGTTYVSRDDSRASIVVTRSVTSGAMGRLATGSIDLVQPGSVWIEGVPTSGPPELHGRSLASSAVVVGASSVELPSQNLPKPKLDVDQSKWKAFWKSIVGLPLLPYRIWRYFQYDQGLRGWEEAPSSGGVNAHLGSELIRQDGDSSDVTDEDVSRSPEVQREQAEADSVEVGSRTAGTSAGAIVAVIDSGVDFNHGAIRSQVWINENASRDARGRLDSYGWDFISGDARPFDDHFHGTMLAGRVLQVEPGARVMPLKVFNPWGVTSSAAIESAFRYAVDHGATVILCGWATQVRSRAIENGVRYAAEHGVLVVAAAGDRGDDLAALPEYPAALSEKYSNVLSVAALSQEGDILRRFGVFSNYGPARVQVGVVAEDLKVPSPRGQWRTASGTGLAAAAVAGWLVSDRGNRWLELPPAERALAARGVLQGASTQRPELRKFIADGQVLGLPSLE